MAAHVARDVVARPERHGGRRARVAAGRRQDGRVPRCDRGFTAPRWNDRAGTGRWRLLDGFRRRRAPGRHRVVGDVSAGASDGRPVHLAQRRGDPGRRPAGAGGPEAHRAGLVGPAGRGRRRTRDRHPRQKGAEPAHLDPPGTRHVRTARRVGHTVVPRTRFQHRQAENGHFRAHGRPPARLPVGHRRRAVRSGSQPRLQPGRPRHRPDPEHRRRPAAHPQVRSPRGTAPRR